MNFKTWWTFRIFFIFSARGGEGGPRRQKGGGRGQFFIENPRRGVSQERGGGGGLKGREGVCGEWGGGLNIFFRGRNAHQEELLRVDPEILHFKSAIA